ncbi:hypothetical protein M9458_056992 [Cirrhinus mrigala]|uniref:SGNH hydrolase-type esterase domain-containing protein n=1 Tax=Cirrhinus mrigala TaxID=683832 RepID=A0ABD0MFP5_CIRMR
MNVGEESPNVTEHGANEPASLLNGRSSSERSRAQDSDNGELQNILMKHKTANRIIIHVAKNDIRKEQLEAQPFISGPLPARGTNMFSWLLGLNTWLQRTCSQKGVNFIDNFNLFWGHRQLFKLDGLHPNKLGARVLKDNIHFSLRHPSVECASPPNMNGTHTPGQKSSCDRHIPQGH